MCMCEVHFKQLPFVHSILASELRNEAPFVGTVEARVLNETHLAVDEFTSIRSVTVCLFAGVILLYRTLDSLRKTHLSDLETLLPVTLSL